MPPRRVRQIRQQTQRHRVQSLGSRNSFVGLQSEEYGAIKLGKTDTPYKTATARLDPFASTPGDYMPSWEIAAVIIEPNLTFARLMLSGTSRRI